MYAIEGQWGQLPALSGTLPDSGDSRARVPARKAYTSFHTKAGVDISAGFPTFVFFAKLYAIEGHWGTWEPAPRQGFRLLAVWGGRQVYLAYPSFQTTAAIPVGRCE